MSEPTQNAVSEGHLPVPGRSWIKTALLGTVLLLCGVVIGSGLTLIGLKRRADEFRSRPDMFSNRILSRMEADLKLTKDQKAELAKIFKETREELDDVRRQHRAQAQAFFREFHDKVANVLTRSQQEQWEDWWKRARERAWKDRGGQPRPGGQNGSAGRAGFSRPPPEPENADSEALGPPPQGIPERHFAPEPAAPSAESPEEIRRVPPPGR